MPTLCRRVALPIFALLFLSLPGCIVVSSNKTYPAPPTQSTTLPHTSAEQIALIDGYADLAFDNDQTRGLTLTARAHNLTAAAQLRLINAACGLSFDNSRTKVFVALASNPCLTAEARTHMLGRLDRLDFDSNHKKVLEALAANPGPPPRIAHHSLGAPTPALVAVDQTALIDVFANQSGNRQKVDSLTKLARRLDLDLTSQRYLIDVTFDRVSSSQGKRDVLVTLAFNPTLDGSTITYLVENIDRLSSSSHQQDVLDALLDRPAHVMADEAEPITP